MSKKEKKRKPRSRRSLVNKLADSVEAEIREGNILTNLDDNAKVKVLAIMTNMVKTADELKPIEFSINFGLECWKKGFADCVETIMGNEKKGGGNAEKKK